MAAFDLPKSGVDVDLHAGLENAILAFEADGRRGISRGPYKIAGNVYESVFDVWSSGLESRWKIAFVSSKQGSKGDVFLYGDPSRLHEVLPCHINVEFAVQMALDGVRHWNKVLRSIGSTRMPLYVRGGIIHKEPDAAWCPGTDPNSHPSMVLEVAVRNESVPRLKQEVNWWSESGVSISLGIKIDVRTKNGITTHNLLFLMHDHSKGLSSEMLELDFSPTVCTRENRGDFLIKIPIAQVLRGEKWPGKDEMELEIDLYEIQQVVLETAMKEFVPDDDICFCRSEQKEQTNDVQHLAVCSNLTCPVAVFHMECVNAGFDDLLPDSKWLCPYCR